MNYLEQYLKIKSLTHPGCIRNYTPILTRLSLVFKELRELTESNLVDYLSTLNKSQKAVKYESMVIQAYLRHWHARGAVSFRAEISNGRIPFNPYPSATEDEFKKIENLDWSDNLLGVRNLLITRLLWETGMRNSELLSLKFGDVDLEECCAKLKTLKNERTRWIFWSDDTNNHFQNYVMSVGFSAESRLFQITPRQVQRIFRKICDQAGVKDLVPHSMRHGKAHRILKKGGTLKDVQETLGHSSVVSSMRYLNLSKEERQERAKMYF
jgi:integrase/recombinase XerC